MFTVLLANVDELNKSVGAFAPLANLSVLAFVLIVGAVFGWFFIRKWLPQLFEIHNEQMTSMREAYEKRTDELIEQSWVQIKDARDFSERQINRQVDHCNSERQAMREAIHALRNQAAGQGRSG